jgi:hypothetical protein
MGRFFHREVLAEALESELQGVNKVEGIHFEIKKFDKKGGLLLKLIIQS